MGQVQKQLDWYRISCCCCAVLTSIIFRSRRESRGTVSCVCKYVMYRVCFVYVNYGCLWKIVCNFESIKINKIQKKSFINFHIIQPIHTPKTSNTSLYSFKIHSSLRTLSEVCKWSLINRSYSFRTSTVRHHHLDKVQFLTCWAPNNGPTFL